jgi:hypothetical protein
MRDADTCLALVFPQPCDGVHWCEQGQNPNGLVHQDVTQAPDGETGGLTWTIFLDLLSLALGICGK